MTETRALTALFMLPLAAFAQTYVVVTDITPTAPLHGYLSARQCSLEALHQKTSTGKNAFCLPLRMVRCGRKTVWSTEDGRCIAVVPLPVPWPASPTI